MKDAHKVGLIATLLISSLRYCEKHPSAIKKINTGTHIAKTITSVTTHSSTTTEIEKTLQTVTKQHPSHGVHKYETHTALQADKDILNRIPHAGSTENDINFEKIHQTDELQEAYKMAGNSTRRAAEGNINYDTDNRLHVFSKISAAAASTSRNDACTIAKLENGISVVDFMPTSDGEFTNIFGLYDESIKVNFLKKGEVLRKSTYGDQYSDSIKIINFPTTRNAYIKELEAIDSNIVIIIGHNVDGKIISRNGSTIEIEQLCNYATIHNKTAIILSCDSKKYLQRLKHSETMGVDIKITQDAAYNLTMNISKIMDTCREKCTDLINSCIDSFSTTHHRIKTIKTVTGGAIIVEIIYYNNTQ